MANIGTVSMFSHIEPSQVSQECSIAKVCATAKTKREESEEKGCFELRSWAKKFQRVFEKNMIIIVATSCGTITAQ